MTEVSVIFLVIVVLSLLNLLLLFFQYRSLKSIKWPGGSFRRNGFIHAEGFYV